MKKETTTNYNAFTPYQKYNNGNLSINRIHTVLDAKKESTKVTSDSSNYNGLDTSELYKRYASGDDSTELLIEMGTRIAYSVLKRLINEVYDSTLVGVRRDVTHAKHNIENIDRLSNSVYSLIYSKDGDLVQTVNNKSDRVAFEKIVLDNLGVGYDLVNTAIIAILEQTEKHGRDLEKKFTERRLKRKVYVKYESSVNGWETVETTPIQEIYREVRREIDKNGSLKISSHKYVYVEDFSYDAESGDGDFFYRQLGLCSDLGGYATDYNGANTVYTADDETVENMEDLIESLNLTARQSQILELRLKGYGHKAIATYLGVTQRAIAKTVEQIRKKAIASGLGKSIKK